MSGTAEPGLLSQSCQGPSCFAYRIVVPLALVLIVLAAYLNTFGVPFMLDDQMILKFSPFSHRIRPESLGPRFLVALTFLGNYLADGFNVAGYHAVNLAIHIAAVLALFGLVRRSLPMAGSGGGQASATVTAAVIAALWGVHPLQTGSVTYISQRYEAMAGLSILFTLYAISRAMTGRSRFWEWTAVAGCGLGMVSKESVLVLPVLAVLYDRVFTVGGWRRVFAERWGLHVALWLTTLVSVGLGRLAGAVAVVGQRLGHYDVVSPWTYLMTQAQVIPHYLRLAVWPVGQCLDYAWVPASAFSEVWMPFLVLGAAAAASLALVVMGRKVGYVGAFFFLTLSPSSSVFPLYDMAFEHRMYLPLAALVVLAVLAVQRLPGRLWKAGVGLVVMVLLLTATYRRNAVYASAERMARDVLEQAPHNQRQHVALAGALLQEQRYVEAETTIRESLAVQQAALAGGPSSLWNCAASDPRVWYPEALRALGLAMMGQGRAAEAEKVFREALTMTETRTLRHNLGVTLQSQGRSSEAIAELRRAVALDARSAESWAFLGHLLSGESRDAEAVDALHRALGRNAGHSGALSQLAWLLATSPEARVRDGAEAVRLATHLQRVTGGGDWRVQDILAAALAEAGQFSEAAGTVRQARLLREKTGGDGMKEDLRQLQEREAQYERSLPHRDARP